MERKKQKRTQDWLEQKGNPNGATSGRPRTVLPKSYRGGRGHTENASKKRKRRVRKPFQKKSRSHSRSKIKGARLNVVKRVLTTNIIPPKRGNRGIDRRLKPRSQKSSIYRKRCH